MRQSLIVPALSVVAVLTVAAAKAASNSDAGFGAKLGEIRGSVLARAQAVQSTYSLHFKGNRWVCTDMGGNEGYNHVGIRKLFASPGCGGECAELSKVAVLRWTNLRGACLRGAYLIGADLSGAHLKWADLRGALLNGADLRGANLAWALLSRADLSGADLRGALLNETDLRGSDLRGADLRGSDLGWAQYNAETRLPIHDDEAKERGMINEPPAGAAKAAGASAHSVYSRWEQGTLALTGEAGEAFFSALNAPTQLLPGGFRQPNPVKIAEFGPLRILCDTYPKTVCTFSWRPSPAERIAAASGDIGRGPCLKDFGVREGRVSVACGPREIVLARETAK